VDDQVIAEEEQAREFTRLKNGPLTVLARNNQPDLESRPLTSAHFTE
jgi:hypothetical protein